MKRGIFFWILPALLLLCACGQKVEESTPTWQEQYDLGIRYLSEGNYEEAIIAFTAAIEIDPKNADAYLALADVYTAQGDTEAARRVLEEGLSQTEDDELRARLEMLGESGETEEEAAITPTPFAERPEYRAFDSLTGEQQALLRRLIAAAELADGTTAVETTWQEFENDTQVYTQIDGYKMWVKQTGHEELNVATGEISGRIWEIEFELRRENGMGYLYMLRDSSIVGHDLKVTSVTCPCVDWQWNGAYEMYSTNVVKADLNWLAEYRMQGMIEDGWRVGEFRYRYDRQVEGREKDEPFERIDLYEKYEQSIYDWGYYTADGLDQYITDRVYW